MRSLFLSLLAAAMLAASTVLAEPTHAIAMHGDPVLPADFHHFSYVNPNAPKGGRVDYAWSGTFDSVNPFIVQGSGARGILDLLFGYNVFDGLMQRSNDEAFSLYPLLAKTVETDDARSFVEFTLDERARFADGEPVKPEDVIFTLELLRDKGLPRYGVTAKKVASMTKVGERGVRFTFKTPDRELPLILGLLPILPRHAIDAATFDKSTLKPLLGSGPYRIHQVRAGESITLKRNPDYWAKHLPSKRGFDNYDEIRLTYYRDDNAMFEAFKKGLIDIFLDTNSGRWTGGYDFPAVARGDVIQETVKTELPSGMFGFVMNSRRKQFSNRQVREGLGMLFDFEWANRTLLSGAYTRTKSFYDNSELSSHGRPASEVERALLAPFPDAVTPEIMAGGWSPPVSDGGGQDRKFLKAGFDRLKAAGYSLANGRMVGPDGAPLAFEVLLKGADGEALAIAWQQTLRKIGVEARVRSVDAAQYQQRLVGYDFDVIVYSYPSSLSPGREQVARWGSASRNAPGTYNMAGVADPAIDALIEALLQTRDRKTFVDAARAYDRALLSGSYVVPLYFAPAQWLARWKHIMLPAETPLYGVQLPTGWRE